MTPERLQEIYEENVRRHGWAPKVMPSYAGRLLRQQEDGSFYCEVPWDDHARAANVIDELLKEVARLNAANTQFAALIDQLEKGVG